MNYGFIPRTVKTSDFFLLLKHVKDPKTMKRKRSKKGRSKFMMVPSTASLSFYMSEGGLGPSGR